MHRIFIEIAGYPIAWFGVMMATAFFAGLLNWNYLGRRDGRDINFCSDLLLWIMVGGVVGARLAYIVSDLPYFLERPIRMLLLTQGGLIYYGGFIGAVVALAFFIWRRHEKPLPLLDFAATSLPLGHLFGRIGCFLNGCCFGSRWDGPLAVSYPQGSFAWQAHLDSGLIQKFSRSLPVHPVQLYEAAFNLLLYAALVWAFKHRRRDGRVVALYLTTYPVARFLLEFLRGDERLRWSGLNVAQEISIVVFAAGCGLWLWTFRTPVATPAQSPLTKS